MSLLDQKRCAFVIFVLMRWRMVATDAACTHPTLWDVRHMRKCPKRFLSVVLFCLNKVNICVRLSRFVFSQYGVLLQRTFKHNFLCPTTLHQWFISPSPIIPLSYLLTPIMPFHLSPLILNSSRTHYIFFMTGDTHPHSNSNTPHGMPHIHSRYHQQARY